VLTETAFHLLGFLEFGQNLVPQFGLGWHEVIDSLAVAVMIGMLLRRLFLPIVTVIARLFSLHFEGLVNGLEVHTYLLVVVLAFPLVVLEMIDESVLQFHENVADLGQADCRLGL
jgi:hypothetical protein